MNGFHIFKATTYFQGGDMKVRLLISLCGTVLIAIQSAYSQWLPINTCAAPNHTVYSVSAVDSNVVWAVLDTLFLPVPVPSSFAPKFIRTSDGGANWVCGTITTASGTLQANYIIDVCALDANTAWVTTTNRAGDGGIYKTTNGGETWALQLENWSWRWVYFFDASNGVAGSGAEAFMPGLMVTTSDGGATWVAAESSPVFTVNEGSSGSSGSGSKDAYGDTVWSVTNRGRVCRSTDRGRNWTVYQTSLGRNASLNSIAFNDGRNGIVVSSADSLGTFAPNRVARTTNGGLTWTTLAPPTASRALSITHVPGTYGVFVLVGANVAGGGPPGSTYSTDFGTTWTQIDTVVGYRSVAFSGPNKGWTGGFTNVFPGGMYRWIGTALTAVEESASLKPDRFLLMQNYPNPFNPATVIRYSLPVTSYTTLKIYNVLGQEVETLVNEVKSPGSNEVTWDARGMVSGVYFYRLAAGTFVETKKLVLLK
jgi:hypothetical protein